MRGTWAAGRRQRGSVAIMTGLLIAVLIGFLGITVDLGRLFVIKSELQTAMDACALSAASQLRPGMNDPFALDRAIAYGRTPPNQVNFQDSGVDPQRIAFSFSDTLAGPYTGYSYKAGGAAVLANSATFARCAYPLEDIPVLFMRVLGSVTEATVSAQAVATLSPSQTNCGFPVAVCRAPTATAPSWGLAPGSWVSGTGAPGGGNGGNGGNGGGGSGGGGSGGGPAGCTSGTGSGNFCWVDYSPPSGGASELSDLIKGQGQCSLTINNPIGQTGVIASLESAWNTRFGIYPPGGGGQFTPTGSPPDYTGHSYTATNWPAQANAYPDFLAKRATNAAFNSSSGININPATPLTSAQHGQYGRDRRLVLAPIVNCGGFTTSQTVPMDAWACMLLLAPITNPGGGSFAARLEYLGLASAPGSPCATSGLGGGTAGPLVPVLVQ